MGDNIVTGAMINDAVHEYAIANDAYPSPLNYYNFPRSVCVSVNEVICHGIPDTRPLGPGDIVNVDVTVYKHGFHADLNETYIVPDPEGKVPPHVARESLKLVEGAYASLMCAIEQCRPGTMYRDLGNTISKVASCQALSVVQTYCGHGVNELFHCAP